MILRYSSGEEIRKGDHILFHREPGYVEFVAVQRGDPKTDWYVEEYGGGIMITDRITGSTFISVDQIADTEDLEFVSRADAP